MEIKQILKHCDHTVLSPSATEKDIIEALDDAYNYSAASACIPPSYVHFAEGYSGGQVKLCTVIGFPNGYPTAKSKVFECGDAIENGADEIDAVINIAALKSGDVNYVAREVGELRRASEGKILKIIVETCLLTTEEKIDMCRIVTDCGADFIKTSTGFSKGGATLEDVALFKKHIGSGVSIKAAGGIRTFEVAEKFLLSGCQRIGTSALIPLAKNIEKSL